MVQERILETIGDWNYIFATQSNFKNDFKHINDMYNLLQYKGYRFPRIRDIVKNEYDLTLTLKTEEELEKEDNYNMGIVCLFNGRNLKSL